MSDLRLLILFLLSSTILAAQPPANNLTSRDAANTTTLGVANNALFDQLMITIAGVGSNSRLIQEQQSLKPYMMPVRRVGFRGSDWSYMLASCLEYYVNINRNYKDNLSPDYISLSLASQGQRPSVAEGLRFLAQNGTVSAAIVPYDAGQIPTTVYATNKYQINNYLHLFQPFASAREKTFEMRKALMRGNPVIIEMQAGPEFSSLEPTRMWEAGRSTSNDQSHILLVVGYDENLQAFEVMSSWGSQWANNGYLWISYNDLANRATNGYVMIPQSS
ncbi:MAG: C1 family peptidase [Bacteroidota bacterium]